MKRKQPFSRRPTVVSNLARQRARLLAKQEVLHAQLESRDVSIAAYRHSMFMDRELLKDQRKKIERLEGEIRRAEDFLRYTIALSAKEVRHQSTFQRAPYVDILTPPEISRLEMGVGAFDLMATATTKRVPIDVMAAKIDRSALNGTHHVRVAYSDSQWGYGFERNAFNHMTTAETAQHIGLELARLIANELNGRPERR